MHNHDDRRHHSEQMYVEDRGANGGVAHRRLLRYKFRGLRFDNAMTHLAALGLMRAWHEGGFNPVGMVSQAGFTVEVTVRDGDVDPVEWLRTRWEPTPTVSVWNAGFGLGLRFDVKGRLNTKPRAQGQSTPAFDALPDRWTAWHDAVREARAISAQAHSRQWTKAETIRACETQYPEAAADWVRACWRPRQDPATSKWFATSNWLLGTGGNIGRGDLGTIAIRYAIATYSDSRSRAWLNDALYGTTRTPLLDTTGAHLTAFGLINPWLWTLALQGLVGLCARAPDSPENMPCRLWAILTSPIERPSDYSRWPWTAQWDPLVIEGEATSQMWLPVWQTPLSWPALIDIVNATDYLGYITTEGQWCPSTTGLDAATSVHSYLPPPLTAVMSYHLAQRNGRQHIFLPGTKHAVGLPHDVITKSDLTELTGVAPDQRHNNAPPLDYTTGWDPRNPVLAGWAQHHIKG